MDESYSYMPNSKIPETVKEVILGTGPAGVIVPMGEMTFMRSPTLTPVVLASSVPIIIPGSCVSIAVLFVTFRCCFSTFTRFSSFPEADPDSVH